MKQRTLDELWTEKDTKGTIRERIEAEAGWTNARKAYLARCAHNTELFAREWKRFSEEEGWKEMWDLYSDVYIAAFHYSRSKFTK